MNSKFWETKKWKDLYGKYGCWSSEPQKHPWFDEWTVCQYDSKKVDTRCAGCKKK